jgi:hypothetical protein
VSLTLISFSKIEQRPVRSELDAPSTREEICKAPNAAKKIKQQETQKSLLAVQYLSDTFKKQETMAESQKSGTGSVEEEIDESPQ